MAGAILCMYFLIPQNNVRMVEYSGVSMVMRASGRAP